MIKGIVTEDREAVIPLRIVGRGATEELRFILDTGFTGGLTLPADIVRRLNPLSAGTRRAILADGNSVALEAFLVTVVWSGQNREVLALQSDGGPLVGLSLLDGSRLIMDVVFGGDVWIDELSSAEPE